MKKTLLISSVTLALTMAAATAQADFPAVIIDSDVILNYDQTIDLTDSIQIPNSGVDLKNADISVNQFNHDSPITATGNVINNTPSGIDGQAITDLQVNVTAVGNNSSIEFGGHSVIGAVQGNQNGGATATGNIIGNRVDLDEVMNDDGEMVAGIVELNVTAVGNNLSVSALDDKGAEAAIGSMQFNYDSPVTATGMIVNNGFGVDPMAPPAPVTPPRGNDPVLVVTAVGNNLSALPGTTGSMTQINRNSPVSATGLISRNLGFVGPVSLDVTAVGNNISITAPTE